MAHIDPAKIRLGFRKVVLTVSDLPPLVSENRLPDETKVAAEKAAKGNKYRYITEQLLMGSQFQQSSGYISTVSKICYSIYVPIGTGTSESDRIGGAIVEKFPVTQPVIEGDHQMVVERAEQYPAYDETEGKSGTTAESVWRVTPVYVTFRLYVNRL